MLLMSLQFKNEYSYTIIHIFDTLYFIYFSSLNLFCTWSSLSEDMIVENQNYRFVHKIQLEALIG